MKICFFAHPNHPNTKNWVEYFSNNFSHEIHLVTLDESIGYNSHVKTHFLKPPVKNKFKYYFIIKSFRNLLTKMSPDIVIAYRLTSYGFIAALSGFHPIVAVSMGQKAGGPHRVIKRPAQWMSAVIALKRADLALAWAPHIANDMISLGCPKNKIFTITRGVNMNLFAFNPKNTNNNFTIVSTRGIHKNYKLDLVIRALKVLRNEIPQIKYVIVGDGEYKNDLIILAKKLDVFDLVEFTGNVEYERIPIYLQKADLYISTVPEDGVSSSLLEAMASGVFPLLPDIEANRLWEKKGGTFLFFKPKNLDEFVEKIRLFFNNKDNYKSNLMKNRKVIDEHASWVKNMEIIEDLFSRLVYSKNHMSGHKNASLKMMDLFPNK